MARSSRRHPPAFEVAEGVTGLWGLLALLLVWLPAYGWGVSWPGSVPLLVGGAVPVALIWAWAVRTAREARGRRGRREALLALSSAGFEAWVGERFRERGYAVTATGTQGTGGDHGVDLLVRRPGETAVVQCKKFDRWTVGEPVLRDLYGAMHAQGADRAYLVTTGRVTGAAQAWARGKPIELWDGEVVARLSATVSGTADALAPGRGSASQPTIGGPCPACGAPLAERRNRRTGEAFRGCSRFPACRHTESGVRPGRAAG